MAGLSLPLFQAIRYGSGLGLGSGEVGTGSWGRPAGAALTSGPELRGCGAVAQPEVHVAGVHHDVVVGVEVAGADDAGGAVAPHQQVVGVRGLGGFHLDAPALAPRVLI